MMYCSSEETKTSNIYRLATILLFFLKKKKSNVYQHQATLFFSFLNFSGCKTWDNSMFSHSSFLSILKSEAGL